MSEIEYGDRLRRIEITNAEMTEKIKGALKRIDEQKQLAESVHAVALSVERLTYKLASTDDSVADLRGDMNDLKARPGRRWDAVVAAVITAVVAFIVGRLL